VLFLPDSQNKIVTMNSIEDRFLKFLARAIGLGLYCALFGTALAQNTIIKGQVVDTESGERLPNANVMVKGTRLGAATNLEGYFVIHAAPDTGLVLIVRYVGYQQQELVFDTERAKLFIIIRLRQSSVLLNEVIVQGEQSTFIKAEGQASLTTLSPRQLESLPRVGQTDIMRSLQYLPGVSNTNDASSGLYVRGGTPDQNLVLFDGMTVYHVDHFYGFFSAFNPDAVKDIRFYRGGYPAEYGGRLSSVVDITGYSGNREHSHFGIDLNLLSANGIAEMPLFDEGAVLIAARRSYYDIINSGMYDKLYKFLTGSSRQPANNGPRAFSGRGPRGNLAVVEQTEPKSDFLDLNAKVTLSATTDDLLVASFYRSLDSQDQSTDSTTQAVQGFSRGFTLPPTVDILDQGNAGASLKWFRRWSDEFFSNTLMAFARYNSNYTYATGGLRTQSQNRLNSNESNSIEDLTLNSDHQWTPAADHKVSFGLQAVRSSASYGLSASTPFNENPSNVLSRAQNQTQISLYAQDVWSMTPVLHITPGLRLTQYSGTQQFYLEPRLGLQYTLTESMSLKAASGCYHQFCNRIVNENLAQGSRDFWLLSDRDLEPATSTDYVVGASYETPAFLIDAELYHKTAQNIVEFSQRFRRGAGESYSFFTGSSRSDGLEILLQKKAGIFNGWISYTLSKTENTFPELNGGKAFPALQDQHHEVKTVATLNFAEDWLLSAVFVFATGKPYSSPVSQYTLTLLDGSTYQYTHVGDKNAYRLPNYQRVDVSLAYQGAMASRTWKIGLSAFNLLNHKNVAYYQYDLTTTPMTIREITGLSFTPTIFVQLDIN
jgi:ferric enterobactin receptor